MRKTFTTEREDRAVEFVRYQIPLILAFAATVHALQGATCGRLILDLRVPVFAHGHLYVALSRARRSRDIRVLLPPAAISAVRATFRTTNVVNRDFFFAVDLDALRSAMVRVFHHSDPFPWPLEYPCRLPSLDRHTLARVPFPMPFPYVATRLCSSLKTELDARAQAASADKSEPLISKTPYALFSV